MSEVIQHVSDTSFWVAFYRALESDRPDAIFQDPYARLLVGDSAGDIKSLRSDVTKWTQWTVVMRTYIIDQMISDLISKGVTTFLNIGAGLDSRPYRMNLPADVQWIEVDFPHVIEHKKNRLQNETPKCQLKRVSLDLSDRPARQALFAELGKDSPTIAVLTEGVLPYLTQEQVSNLSEDLMQHSSFKFWIGDYISAKSYRYLKDPKRMKILKNAPFQFYPEDWMDFFEKRGWHLQQAQYYTEISEKLGRPSPMPKIFKLLELILGKKWALPFKRMSGYLLWAR
ncbi:MAG: class I SAM-dependent methyltransferase [Pseudobdellovibrionaceae bacterium]